jgi:uncharacterized membrane protein YedE/YeeE
MAEANILNGIIGGALIGVAAVLLLWLNGRIAGVSGILNGILTANSARERWWRGAFVAGLIIGAAVYAAHNGYIPLDIQTDGLTLIIAGLLVGFGTRLGSGCTSGHGVCGLARRSPRSLMATLTFMLVGVATVYIARHVFS